MKPAVFLDRDGVLIKDVDLLTRMEDILILRGVPDALEKLHRGGFALIVASNQPVVARGLATEKEVATINRKINSLLGGRENSRIVQFYFCPHHPKATLEEYRVICDCRKPQPGMLLRATIEHRLDLKKSFMVGDRITDIIAGARAGCRTVLVETGRHSAPPIETADPLDDNIKPDYICGGLPEAVEWILSMK